MMENNNLHFKTNVQLKSIIGKDLINDDNIAILELVKNSFDADSKTVFVRYLNLKENDDSICETYTEKTSRLIIQDNGLGMNIDDIQNKWLNIAYSEKKANKMQHNRRMAGAKGVGRFSCDRLGEYLNLITKKSGDEKFVRLSINWKLFEVEDNKKEIQSVPIIYDIVDDKALMGLGYLPFEQGVLLEIIKLRSLWVYPKKDEKGNILKWNVDKLVGLKKYLEKLINPSHAFENNDFGILLEAQEFIDENEEKEEHDKFIGKVENRVFDKLDFKSTSIETHTFNNGEFIYTELKDKGDTVFWIKERNLFFPFIKNVKVSLYYLNPYAKAFFTKQTGIQVVNYGSVFLFINGFRIPPYGEVGNDWLGIDQRKTQGYGRNLGLREIVGQIEVLDDNNDFQIISSREGIVRNDNYFKLTESENHNSYFFKAFRRLERYVVEGLNWDSSIYETKDPQFKEIEQKIISGRTTEDELEYREDENTKKSRIYSAIHSIISAKPVDVLELYINEGLIIQKIEEERTKSEAEFEQLIEDFENKKIDSDTLNRILQKKAEQNKELEKQLKEFSKYTTNEVTSRALLELQEYKKRVEQQTLIIEGLQTKLEELTKEKTAIEDDVTTLRMRAESAEIQAAINKERLEIEKRKNVYLQISEKDDISQDTETLIHSIKDSTSEINASLKHIHRLLSSKNSLSPEILEYLRRIENQNKKTNMLAKLISRADLREEKMFVNVPDFIIDYLQLNNILSKPIILNYSEDLLFNAKINLVDLGIAIDELFINSKKAGATQMAVDIKVDDHCHVTFKDNGRGVPVSLLVNPVEIFTLGVSTTSGSGTGLYNARRILEDSYATLTFEGNNKSDQSGAIFKILFK